MQAKRLFFPNFLILGCLLVFLVVFFLFAREEIAKESTKTYEKKHNLQKIKADGVKLFRVNSSKKELKIFSEKLKTDAEYKVFLLEKPQGKLSLGKKKPLFFQGREGEYFAEGKKIVLNAGELRWEEGELKAKSIEYDGKKESFLARKNVRSYFKIKKDVLKIRSQYLSLDMVKKKALYRQQVVGALKLNTAEGDINFKCHQLEVWEKQGVIKLKGDVTLSKGNLNAHAHKGSIFYNKKRKVEGYELEENVLLKQYLNNQSNVQVERKAYAEKLIGDMAQGKVVLKGNPRVVQEGNTIKGKRITLYEKQESIEIDRSISNIVLEENNL